MNDATTALGTMLHDTGKGAFKSAAGNW